MWDKETRFTALVEAYSTDLFRYGCWLCRDPELARDLVQETFARTWKSLDRLRNEKAAKSWLITTLRREYARTFEKQRPQTIDFDPDLLTDPNRDYDTSTEAFVLRGALAKLSDDYREPLVLQVIYGYSCEEIGALLGLSRAAVMTRLFRARKFLRAILDERPDAERGISP